MYLNRLIRTACLFLLLILSTAALAATYTVDNTGDSGTNSLRDAIANANANAGTDTIDFAIPGSGPFTIQIASPLPTITDPVIINGMTQSGSSANTLATGSDAVMMIVIRPSVGSTATNALTLTSGASNSIIRGLVIGGFSGQAIYLNSADGVSIMGNFLGVNAAGTAADGNQVGVMALNGANGTVIGSPLAADRNVISGNGAGGISVGDSGTTVQIYNNYIGTNAAGTAAIQNVVGVKATSATQVDIGDETAGYGNVISGNFGAGIVINSATAAAYIEGNLIGLASDGTTALGNSGDGIAVYQTSGYAPALVSIGGATSAFFNKIAYNTSDGVALWSASPQPQAVTIAGNSIYSNNALGIDLDNDGATANDVGDGDSGSNGLQNFPVITSAVFNSATNNITINGTLNSLANSSFDLRFFQNGACDASGYGEGETYLGLTSVTTDPSGDATFSVTLPGTAGGVVTATATNNATGGTSEFSQCASVSTAVTPTATIDDPSVTEGDAGTTTLTYTVTLSVATTVDVSVDFATADGSAAQPGDYSSNSGTLTIPAGNTTGTINVTIKGDTTVEPDETVLLNLTNPSGLTLSDTQGSGTIQNDDALPTVTITDVAQNEGNGGGTTSFTFTVTLSAPALSTSTVDWATADNAAVAPGDYTAANGTLTFNAGDQVKTLTIDVNADAMYEGDEVFFVNFTNPSNIDLTDNQAAGTIQNDDPIPTVTIDDPSVTEGDSGTANLTYTVTLSNPSQTNVSVFFSNVDGTATAPSDYTPNGGSFTVLSGALTATMTVGVNGDTNIEPDETVLVNLTSATGATILDNQGVGTIVNDDGLVTPSITISDPTVVEGNVGTTKLTYVVTLSSASASDVSVNWATANGSATAGSDYAAGAGTLTIPSGSTTGQIDVNVSGDTSIEPNETVLMNLSSPVNATILDNQGVGTIANDDGLATPGISIGDVSQAEGNSGSTLFTFTISLSQASASDVSVTATTSDGTASAGAFSDYTFQTNTVTIPSGNTSGTFTVAVHGDANVEGDETFFVDLTNPVNGNIIDAQATGTIQNDDAFGSTALNIQKTGPATVAPGGNIVYTIVVANNGAIAATNVVVTDPIPGVTSFVSANATQGSCSGTTTVTCTLGTINAGNSATITLTVQAPSSPMSVSNTATVAADQTNTAASGSTANTNVSAAAVAAIPTLSEWALIALALAVAAAAAMKLRV